MVEEADNEGTICDGGREGYDLPESSTVGDRKGEKHFGQRSKKEVLSKANVLEWLERHLITPTSIAFRTRLWLEGPFGLINDSNPIIQQTMTIYRTRMARKSFLEICQLHINPNILRIYGSIDGDVQKDYYDEDTSINILEDFLQFQANHNGQDIVTLLSNVYLILSKQGGKKNCLELYGAPDCGKSWFTFILGEFMINTGIIGHWNKYSQFALEDCIDRNLLIMDEPSVEPAAFETFKLLFAGCPVSANIKFRAHCAITHTPTVIAANRRIFPQNEQFEVRMLTYCFEKYTFEDKVKRVLPVALLKLFIKYNIVEME